MADCSISTGFESSLSGKVVVLRAGFLYVYGVHGPWMDGTSVWKYFRNRVALELPFCVRRRWTHFVTSSSVLFRMHNQWRSPFKYSATMTGNRCRLGFTYTTTPGFWVEKSTSLFSKKSLKINSNEWALMRRRIPWYHALPYLIPLLAPLLLQNFNTMRCNWQTYRPTPFCSGARGKPDFRNKCELLIWIVHSCCGWHDFHNTFVGYVNFWCFNDNSPLEIYNANVQILCFLWQVSNRHANVQNIFLFLCTETIDNRWEIQFYRSVFARGEMKFRYTLFGCLQRLSTANRSAFRRFLSTKEPEQCSQHPGKMKGWQIHEYGGVELLQCNEHIKIPSINSPNDVLVKVRAASVNPIDVAMMG